MDNTSRDAAAAKAAGMSYGQWKILHPETAPKKVEKKLKYQRVCPYCLTEFDTDRADKKFCCPQCSSNYNRKNWYRMNKERKNAMSQL